MDKTIIGHWNSYRDKVVHEEASEIQLRETELAFYAGVICLYKIFESIGIGEKNGTLDEIIAMDNLISEVENYMERQRENF